MLPLILLLLSLIPHLYVFVVGWGQAGPSLFLFGLLIANLFPVALGYYLTRTRFRSLGFGVLLATAAFSSWALWVGMLRPKGSTASLIFLFLPLWNTFVVGPVGAGLAAATARCPAAK